MGRAPGITAHYGRGVEPVATDAARRGTTAPGPRQNARRDHSPSSQAEAWRGACRRWGHALVSRDAAGAPSRPASTENAMEPRLDPVEIRVLGCLIEKQVTTPEYYPLTLNGLVNACNQTTNRSPVTSYDEGTVARALLSLDRKGLLWTVQNSRVPKYGERLKDKLNLDGSQLAAICVLMLRGSQTPGEVRARTGRLHPFASLAEA